MIQIELTINGQRIEKQVDENRPLLRFLRDDLGLIGTKNGCGEGHCGTCTVIINGKAKRACVKTMGELQGARITTIEGIGHEDSLDFIQQAFIDEGAVQCGFCTPGMVMTTKALLDNVAQPTNAQIEEAFKNNICRCTGYAAIKRAVLRAAGMLNGMDSARSIGENPQTFIGTNVLRKDVTAKVRGERVFADDYSEADMLWGKLVLSEYAHARIVDKDLIGARASEGVVAVLTSGDIPGRNSFGLFIPQQPVMAVNEVKFLGEVLACVYAETREQAEAAAKKVRITYEPLKALMDARENFESPVEPVHNDCKDNIVHHVDVRKGDVDRAFAMADVVVEGCYETQAVEHAYLEPEACLARPEADGTITLYSGSQGSIAYQKMLAASLNLPVEKIRIIYTPCGGAFGGKEEPTCQIQAALGALVTGRTVKITLNREESIRMSTKRHPMKIWMTHGAMRDGRIVAMRSKIIADAGAYISQSIPVIFRSAVTATGPYAIENVSADSYGIYTHNIPSGACRGFGSTQPCFAAEIQMDKLARAIGMDAAQLRRMNGFARGKETGTGQILEDGIGYMGTLEAVAGALENMKVQYNQMDRPVHKKLGFGLASSYKNVGIGNGTPDKAGVMVDITPKGRVLIKIGATDMGQGLDTIMAQIAATALNADYDSIDIIAGDTALCPDSGMTTASRQTFVTGNAVKLACETMRTQLTQVTGLPQEAWMDRESLKDLYALAEKSGISLSVSMDYYPPKTYAHRTQASPMPIHYAYCFASAAVALEVNTETGEVKILKIAAAQDVGKAINPANIRGQIEGAVAMGIGYALSEEFLQDETHVITDTFKKLHVPNMGHVPEIECFIIENEQEAGPYGAKGMGEVGVNPVAPAISNAIFDAIGRRMQSLPIKAEKILAALATEEKDPASH